MADLSLSEIAQLRTLENRVKEQLPPDPTGHDWPHTERVRRMALYLHQREGGDRFIIECAALLHDVCDWKFHPVKETAHPDSLRSQLLDLSIDQARIERVIEIIQNISFKGAGTAQPELSLEGKIVQDADRLDALGAIGIARAFAYGGFRQRLIYDPAIEPVYHKNFKEYQTAQTTTLNHFYEKLLLLKDRMHTSNARQIAEERHRFLELFLHRFFNEWNGP